jgi:hypothetical protein
MSELKILTLHKEEGKYAYFHVENLNMNVILIHNVPKEDMRTLVESLEQKFEHQCNWLIILDKDKETPFDNRELLSNLIIKNLIPESPNRVFKIEPLPEMTMPFISDTRPKNPHRNTKSSNCKIRRK